MTKEDNEDFKNTTKCWIRDNDYVDNDVKVRDNCHITGKYRAASAQRDCNILNRSQNQNSCRISQSKKLCSHLITQELGKFNLKINVIPYGLEKYMSFTINNKLSFIDSFQFLSFSLDSLFKHFNRGDFTYFSQEFDNNVLDLVKQKEFYPGEYTSNFKK